jgi:hypothetical protein
MVHCVNIDTKERKQNKKLQSDLGQMRHKRHIIEYKTQVISESEDDVNYLADLGYLCSYDYP